MLGFGIGEVISFFVIVAACLGVVIAWVVRSEANRKLVRSEMKRLRSQVENSEREKFMLLEEMESLKDLALSSDAEGPGAEKSGGSKVLVKKLMDKNESLEEENARLKADLKETRGSLEEVYKALCEQ
jgi:predicted AAA+ superfamily ATPase